MVCPLTIFSSESIKKLAVAGGNGEPIATLDSLFIELSAEIEVGRSGSIEQCNGIFMKVQDLHIQDRGEW
jgi:hypothetical protein